ncbi:putative glycoside hydrolase [Candidatus Parcubacteria bacterium]|nr:putative glycoside hydrolase [Candidatus Parcubacteria bacterium]
MGPVKLKNFIFLFICLGIFLISVVLVFTNHIQNATRAVSSQLFVYSSSVSSVLHPEEAPIPLAVIPSVIKSVYVTGWSAGSQKYNTYLQSLFTTTQINAVVVDIKDNEGFVSYNTAAPKALEYGAYHGQIRNINSLINSFHNKGIYVIGRIVLFEDPVLAHRRPDLAIYDTSKTPPGGVHVPWRDNNGVAWMDPAQKEVLDYNIEIAKDALLHGFDEINFDYVRFPTDGRNSTMGFSAWDGITPKHVVMKTVFQRLRAGLPNARISADIFGQVTSNTDDMGIGQLFEDALPYFDVISPMVYPSHYITGFLGYKNPADYPYEMVKFAIDSAIARKKVYDAVNNKLDMPPVASAKIRPWLQDFNVGAMYDAKKIRGEIQAVVDATGPDFAGYMLWNPLNRYTKEAVSLPAGAL